LLESDHIENMFQEFKDNTPLIFCNSIWINENKCITGELYQNDLEVKKKYNNPLFELSKNNFIELGTSNKETNFSPNIPKNSDEIFNILFVGGYSKLKGTHIIIKTLNLLKDKYNVKLNIYGYKKDSSSKVKKHLFSFHGFYVNKIDRLVKNMS